MTFSQLVWISRATQFDALVLKAVNFYQTRVARSLHGSRLGRRLSMECDRSLNLMIPACNWTLAVLSPVLSPTINSSRLTAFSWQSIFVPVVVKDEHPSLQASQSTRPTPELRQWTLQIYPMTHNATRSPPFMRARILVRRISRDPFHFLPPLSTLWYVTHHLDTWVFRMCCRNNESIMQSVSDSIEHLLVSIYMYTAHEYWALLCKTTKT